MSRPNTIEEANTILNLNNHRKDVAIKIHECKGDEEKLIDLAQKTYDQAMISSKSYY